MKTHSPLLSHRTILMIAIFAITPTIIASVFIMPDSMPYTILLISLLTAFCIIILVKIKIKNKSLSQHYYNSKTSLYDWLDIFDQIEKEMTIELPYLSMGMSDDYLIALKHGATHIRLGRILYEN